MPVGLSAFRSRPSPPALERRERQRPVRAHAHTPEYTVFGGSSAVYSLAKAPTPQVRGGPCGRVWRHRPADVMSLFPCTLPSHLSASPPHLAHSARKADLHCPSWPLRHPSLLLLQRPCIDPASCHYCVVVVWSTIPPCLICFTALDRLRSMRHTQPQFEQCPLAWARQPLS